MDEDGVHIEITTNAEEVIDLATRLHEILASFGNLRATSTVEIDHDEAVRALTEIENRTARMRADAVGIPVEVEADQAERDLQAIQDETRVLNASVVNLRVIADTSQATREFEEAKRQLALFQNETARLGAQKIGVTIETNAELVDRSLKEILLDTQRINAERARATVTAPADTSGHALDAQRREVAEIDNLTARMRATKVGVSVDGAEANRSLQEIQINTQKVNALVAQKRALAIDVSEANAGLGGLMDKLGAIAAYSAGYQAFHAVEVAVGGAARAIIGFNDKLENTKIAFTQSFGSAALADRFLGQLKDFAERTPFQFDQVTVLSQRLLGAGIAARDIIPALTAIGDAVAGTAGDADSLNRIVLAYGQISSAGKATAQDLRQLTEAGIPAYSMLAKVLHTDVAGAMAQVTAGAVDADTALKGLREGMEGRYGGLMASQMGTLRGMVSNLQDTFQREAADLGMPLFEGVKSAVAELAVALQSDSFKGLFAGMAQDAADALHVFEELLKLLEKVPAPVAEAAIHLAEWAVALKAAEVALGALRAILGPVALLLGVETKQIQTQNTELAVNTGLWNANAAAKARSGEAGVVASGGGLAGGIGQLAGGSILGRIGGALTGGSATGLGAAGVGAGVAIVGAEIVDSVNSVVRDLIKKQWSDALSDVVSKAPATPWGLANVVNDIVEKISGKDFVHALFAKAGYDDLPALVRDMVGKTNIKQAGGLGEWVGNLAEWADIGQEKAPPTPAQPSPEDSAKAQKIIDEYRKASQIQFEQAAQDSLKGTSKFGNFGSTEEIQAHSDAVRAAMAEIAHAFEGAYGDTDKYEALLREFNQTLDETTESSKRQLVQRQQQHDQMLKDADEIRREAAVTGLAEPADVMKGLSGTDKASADQVKLIKARYDAMMQAQKQAEQAMLQEEQAFQQRLVQATQSASQAIGRIDLSKGLTGLASVAPDLEKARDALASVGTQDKSLDTLATIAESFKVITDAEHEAAQAYEGYLTLFDETDQRIQVLDKFKKRLDDAVKAAQEAQKNGTITPQQQELLGKASDAYANIAATRGQLQANQASDILGMGQSLPKLTDADEAMRSMAASYGSMKDLRIQIETNVKQVESDLDALVNKPWTIHIDVKTNLPGGGLTGDPGQFDPYFAGRRTGDPGEFDPYYYGRQLTGDPGQFDPYYAGRRTGDPGEFDPYYAGRGQSSGSTKTPNGDAARIGAWKGEIDRAAAQYGIDPYLLGAIIMHESGGTPGIVNPKGGASGLTQVFPSAHRDEDYDLLRGTSPEAIQYQIDEGAKILAHHIAVQGGNVKAGVANYGGYDASDPTYYDDLQGYMPGVRAALGSSSQSGGTGARVAQQAVNDTGAKIVQTALQHVGEVNWVGYCEGFIEDMIEKVTGQRGATGRAGSAAQALAAGQAAGLQVSKAQAQPGDLVYYGGTATNPAGHVAIYMGGGQQVSTADSRGGTDAVHVETVGPGAQYIHVPAVGTSGGKAPALPGQSAKQFDTADAFDPDSPAAVAAREKRARDQEAAVALTARMTSAQAAYNDELRKIDPNSVAEVQKQFSTLLGVMTKVENAKLGPDASQYEKTMASAAAMTKASEAATLWAEGVQAVNDNSDDLAGVQSRIADTVGGPVADAMNKELDAMKEQKATAEEVVRLQAEKVSLEETYRAAQRDQQDSDRERARSQTLTQRGDQDSDRDRSRGQTLKQRGEQDEDRDRQRAISLEARGIADLQTATQRRWRSEQEGIAATEVARQTAHTNAMRAIQDRTTAETASWTTESRTLEDERRLLTFQGTEKKRALVQEQRDREDAHRDETAGEDAKIQLAKVGVRTGIGLDDTAISGQQLAALVDLETTQEEAYKKATEDNKTLQDKQDIAFAQEMYDLETKSLAESRAHEDRVTEIGLASETAQRAYEDETARLAAADVQRQQSHQLQLDLWQDEDTARSRRNEDEQFAISVEREMRNRAYEDETFAIEGERLARQRAYDDETFAIEAERLAEQRAHEDQMTSIDAEIKAAQVADAAAQSRLKAAQDALTQYGQVDDMIQKIAGDLRSIFDNLPYDQGVTKKAGGGYVSGTAIVGDTPGGDLSAAEVVQGNFSVLSHGQSVAQGYIPGGGISRYVNGTQGAAGGDTTNVVFQASGNTNTDEALFAKLTAWLAARDRAGEVQVRRDSMRGASEGGGRY